MKLHQHPCTACGGRGPHEGPGHVYTTQPRTADTITDEQIRELWSVAGNEITGPVLMAALSRPYHGMLGDEYDARQRARARCAEILNARYKDQTP